MKKVIFIAASFFALAACNKEVISSPEEGVGYLNFSLAADDIVVSTKTQVSELDDYNVYINGQSHEYGSEIKGKVLTKSPGEYTVYAENITPAEANQGRGSLRLMSAQQSLNIEAGETKTVTLECGAVNAKIEVIFNQSFQNAFQTWSLTLGYENDDVRDLTSSDEQSAVFYYEPGKLALELTATSQNGVKTHSEPITVVGGYHYTVNYSAGENGYLGITVTADDKLLDADDNNVTVNPYI